MGRHSRKTPAAAPAPDPAPAPAAPGPERHLGYDYEYGYGYENQYEYEYDHVFEEPRARRRPEPTVTHQGYVPQDLRAGGHPQSYESGGAWGAGPDTGSRYGDWRGAPRPRSASAPTALLDTDTPAFGTPAVGFPQINLAQPAPMPAAAPAPPPVSAPDPVTSTGSHRKVRVPGPRGPADPVAPEAERPGSGRGLKVRTYTGMAAAAVTTVLAVVVAGQVTSEGEGAKPNPLAAPGEVPADNAANSPSPQAPVATTPAAPPAPAAPEPTYEQKMAQQLPIDAKLTGPGTFDTVPGVAKAPGKGRLVRYRVDVEQGLALDSALFAEAVHRTLNDDRSWGHGGAMTFERVPGGTADFVVTLASPGTTGKWCAKSGLDTTIDNVSCDSASTERVMINAFRWAQGSATYGPEQMFSYRQMLINHEVGHRLGHGHVSCKTPGALAPIMQQQTKSLDIDGIQCKPNPWVYPGS
ncbi:DUF3152 domain-containing protein [Streptomyces sp. NPDC091371]|uniref:DUF3152 domain-containing protein n=1 Tax=Streptomyces sp. NPDC091371 TaxID=3155303 RepID=UPI003434E7C7